MIPSIISIVTKYDKRGNLSIIEEQKDIPLRLRGYIIYGTIKIIYPEVGMLIKNFGKQL